MLKKLLQHISIPLPGHEKPKLRRRIALRRYLAAMLCGCMMVPTIGSIAMATEETAYVSGPCEHHTEHDADCGYVEAVEGADCQHIHDENCGYVEAKDEVPCYCADQDGDGVIDHAEGCGYQAPVEGQPCNHVHDTDCGYAEAVEGQPCGYVCEICSSEEIGSEPTPLSDAVMLESDAEPAVLNEAESEITAYAAQAEGIPEPTTAPKNISGVAAIGEKGYNTLKAAISAASAGDTITLLQSIPKESVTINKSITLDMAGHTLVGTGSAYAITIKDAEVTIKNGIISGGAKRALSIINAKTQSITLDNVTIQNTTADYSIYAVIFDGTFTATDCRFTGNKNTKSVLYLSNKPSKTFGTGAKSLTNCIFEGNNGNGPSTFGPLQISNVSSSLTTLTNCTFTTTRIGNMVQLHQQVLLF